MVRKRERRGVGRRRGSTDGLSPSPATADGPATDGPADGHATVGVPGEPTTATTDPWSDPAFLAGLRPVPSGRTVGRSVPAFDLVGSAPDGTPVELNLEADTAPLLLVFLSTDCQGCDVFWGGFSTPTDAVPPGADQVRAGAEQVRAVLVVKGQPGGDTDAVATLAAEVTGATVLVSDRAWTEYRVLGYPYLVVVDPTAREVLAETTGFRWSDVDGVLTAAGVR